MINRLAPVILVLVLAGCATLCNNIGVAPTSREYGEEQADAPYNAQGRAKLDRAHLYQELLKLGHPADSWLPLDYQPVSVGGGGRTLQDDWVTCKTTPRIQTAYAVPLPYRRLAGNAEPEWIPLHNPNYPLAPGAQTKIAPWYDGTKDVALTWVLTMTSVHPAGQWSLQEAYINGRWIPAFYTRSISVMGKRLTIYAGCKFDVDGPMAWFPEASLSWVSVPSEDE